MSVKTLGLFLAFGAYALSSTPTLPKDVARGLSRLKPSYVLGGKASPQFLRGDFDGDGKPDLALEIVRAGKQGLAIFLSSQKEPILIAAGRPFFAWPETSMDFDNWSLHRKQTSVEKGVEAGPPPTLRGDALYLEWDGSGSGLVYWTGTQFEWYQQGD